MGRGQIIILTGVAKKIFHSSGITLRVSTSVEVTANNVKTILELQMKFEDVTVFLLSHDEI